MTEKPQQLTTPVIEVRMDDAAFRELAVIATDWNAKVDDASRYRPVYGEAQWSEWPFKWAYFLGNNPASLILATSYLRVQQPEGLFEVLWYEGPESGTGKGEGVGPGYVVVTDYSANQ